MPPFVSGRSCGNSFFPLIAGIHQGAGKEGRGEGVITIGSCKVASPFWECLEKKMLLPPSSQIAEPRQGFPLTEFVSQAHSLNQLLFPGIKMLELVWRNFNNL